MTLPAISRQSVRASRSRKEHVDPNTPIAVWNERECGGESDCVDVTTVILVGAECRFACTMCDLWKHTLDHATPPGSLVRQLDAGLAKVPKAQWIKLYNASNFFDPYAVPTQDLPEIARRCSGYDRVIVENHPRLLKPTITEFAGMISGKLEVAMGLETINPESLSLLNKESTLDDFEHACRWLIKKQVDVRAFVLLQPPGTFQAESIEWAVASVGFAMEHGARHVSLIPTRGGDGLMIQLEQLGEFRPPSANQLELALDQSLHLAKENKARCVVTADLWDWASLRGHCEVCSSARKLRIEQVNLSQQELPMPDLSCPCCAQMN
jgi:archaeosine synthase beta-subunit